MASQVSLPSTEADILNASRQVLIAHANDQDGHDLAAIRCMTEITEGKTGLWSIVAADDFAGSDGALTITETGGYPWIAVGAGQPLHRIGGTARSPDGSLRGTYIAANVSDGQIEARLAPGTLEASLYFRWKQNGDYLMLQRGSSGAIGLKSFINGATFDIAPIRFVSVEADERFKIRFVGSRIWAFRVAAGVETLIFDVTEPQWQTAGSAGIRLNGTGSADSFRLLKREAL